MWRRGARLQWHLSPTHDIQRFFRQARFSQPRHRAPIPSIARNHCRCISNTQSGKASRIPGVASLPASRNKRAREVRLSFYAILSPASRVHWQLSGTIDFASAAWRAASSHRNLISVSRGIRLAAKAQRFVMLPDGLDRYPYRPSHLEGSAAWICRTDNAAHPQLGSRHADRSKSIRAAHRRRMAHRFGAYGVLFRGDGTAHCPRPAKRRRYWTRTVTYAAEGCVLGSSMGRPTGVPGQHLRPAPRCGLLARPSGPPDGTFYCAGGTKVPSRSPLRG
jgi:hypothetical protein